MPIPGGHWSCLWDIIRGFENNEMFIAKNLLKHLEFGIHLRRNYFLRSEIIQGLSRAKS
jgi:hypothetical protein